MQGYGQSCHAISLEYVLNSEKCHSFSRSGPQSRNARRLRHRLELKTMDAQKDQILPQLTGPNDEFNNGPK